MFSYVVFVMQLQGLYIYLQGTWLYSCYLTCKLTLKWCQMIPVREMIYTLCMALADVGHWHYIVYGQQLLVLCLTVTCIHTHIDS